VLLPSFVATATWDGLTRYRVYVGYDAGDPVYDHDPGQRALRAAFERITGERPVELLTHRCVGTGHAPVAVWNRLFRAAYADGCDFFYQLGDDVRLDTAGWARDLPAALQLNPVFPGLGVAGPADPQHAKLLTQSFVSRIHMDLFGTYYPPVFRNWWSDDWMTEVYGADHARRLAEHTVTNTSGARYRVDRAAEARLAGEVSSGRARLAAWLAARTPAPPGAGADVIAFSLWGSNPRYTAGAVRNAELARTIYPGWTCRFYVSSSVPASIVGRLAEMPNTELIGMEEAPDWRGLLWRFLPAADEHVRTLLVRDADSRLNERERAAVDAWLASDRDVHIMRDHPHHTTPILGGMWGVRRGRLWNMRGLLAKFTRDVYEWQADQDFLRDLVYPLVVRHALVHDSRRAGSNFPHRRQGDEFVGQVFDEHDRPLHPAHVPPRA
jgi:hypothetical protein